MGPSPSKVSSGAEEELRRKVRQSFREVALSEALKKTSGQLRNAKTEKKREPFSPLQSKESVEEEDSTAAEEPVATIRPFEGEMRQQQMPKEDGAVAGNVSGEAKDESNEKKNDDNANNNSDKVNENKEACSSSGFNESTATEEDIQQKAEAFKNQGNEYLRKENDAAKAIAAYTAAISLLSRHYVYYNNRAAAFILAEEFEKAIEDCDRSLELQPSAKAYIRKASALGGLGELDVAVDMLAKGFEMNANDAEAKHVRQVLSEVRAEKLKRIEEQEVQSKPRSALTDKIQLPPLVGAGVSAVKQRRGQNNGLLYTQNTCTVNVQAIGLSESLPSKSNKLIRLHSSDIEQIIGKTWNIPTINLSASDFESEASVEPYGQGVRGHLTLKSGRGGVFRAKNARSGVMGGLCVWKCSQLSPASTLDCIACWNPYDFCHDYDWEVGDKIEFLDFSPLVTRKINKSLAVIDTRETGPQLLGRVSTFHVIGTASWMGDGRVAAFGQCGLVGDHWGQLTLEAGEANEDFNQLTYPVFADIDEFLNKEKYLDVIGIRTDCLKLPFSVSIKRRGDADWEVCAEKVMGPYVDISIHDVYRIRLVWESTDLHMMDGLCSPKGGGGLHAELIVTNYWKRPISDDIKS